jgi:hypothetical protein
VNEWRKACTKVYIWSSEITLFIGLLSVHHLMSTINLAELYFIVSCSFIP